MIPYKYALGGPTSEPRQALPRSSPTRRSHPSTPDFTVASSALAPAAQQRSSSSPHPPPSNPPQPSDGADRSPASSPSSLQWLVVRTSLLCLCLLALFRLATFLHPSPWLEPSSPISPAVAYPRPPPLRGPHSPPVRGCRNAAYESSLPREKAAILILAREQDLKDLLPTLEDFERRFNRAFRYPYVFLNDQSFPPSFKRAVSDQLGPGREVEWGTVPKEWWSVPSWVGEAKAQQAFREQAANGVQYAGKESYHHMCRFYSGLFARHPMLAKYDWYWRLEPGVRFYVDITYDPFRFLAQREMVYGFVITIVENANTIPTLFDTMLKWRDQNKHYSFQQNPLWEFFLKQDSKNRAEEYNLCHFWTNFEIGNLDFFRGKEYQSLFDYLDKAGGFYTERWGDAPIRSLALGLLADYSKVHYFEDLAYKHDWFMHCSADPEVGCNQQCPAPSGDNWDIDRNLEYSCLPRWRALDQAW